MAAKLPETVRGYEDPTPGQSTYGSRLPLVAKERKARSTLKALKTMLAINGVVFLVRAFTNLFRPTSWYVDADAPRNAVDAVHVVGITQGALGLTQIGMWTVDDRRAVRAVSGASMFFAVGIALKALSQGSSSTDAFHRMRYASAAENIGVAAVYGGLLLRERLSGNRPESSGALAQ